MKEGFCWNSRMWIVTMIARGVPKTCPYYEEQLMMCDRCGYYEEREVTEYRKRLEKILKSCGVKKNSGRR